MAPKYSHGQLNQYIELITIITGKKPDKITVSQECLDWYREQVKQIAKNFNIPTTKNYKTDAFMGVELVIS